MKPPTQILCFTDVLCGYCYLGDAHLDRLKADFGDQVRLSYHFMSVYGDVRRRIHRSGKSDGAFGAMVHGVLERYDHLEVHPEVFQRELPASSVPAHLYLRAVKVLEDEGVLELGSGPSPFERLMWEIRLAYFRDLRDISKRNVLDDIAGRSGIPNALVGQVIDDGRAFAELAHDAELQRTHGVTMAPSLVLSDGRLLLEGNLGYREVELNIRALLSNRFAEASLR